MFWRLLFSNPMYLALRLLVAGVFIIAAVPKLAAPGDFAQVISGYGLTPDWLNPALAVALPLAELGVAVLLVLNRPGGVLGATLFLAGFSMVLAYGIFIGLDVDCGCFGPGDPEAEAYHGLDQALQRDLWLLTACGWMYLRQLVQRHIPAPLRVRVKNTEGECDA
ncbi:MAG: DoxX family protein [Proteobacteria bacterium]|nr:DoxX family protein [Pseudomonadota bacterium]MBU1611950.1 DoxX family protein [Pseudomonadota bacterium]